MAPEPSKPHKQRKAKHPHRNIEQEPPDSIAKMLPTVKAGGLLRVVSNDDRIAFIQLKQRRTSGDCKLPAKARSRRVLPLDSDLRPGTARPRSRIVGQHRGQQNKSVRLGPAVNAPKFFPKIENHRRNISQTRRSVQRPRIFTSSACGTDTARPQSPQKSPPCTNFRHRQIKGKCSTPQML